MYRQTTLAVALAAAVATLVSGTMTASSTELKYSSWTPPPAPNNRYGSVPLFKEIEEATKGTPNELTFKNFMGAQLYNAFTTLAGVRDGAVDAGVTVPVFNAAELAAHTIMADMQALAVDGYATAAAGTEVLLLNCPECVENYAKNNTLSLGVYSGTPYYMMCNFEVKSIDDLKGKKSVEGNAMFARWGEVLGMTRIQMGINDYQQALARGTADCVFGPKEWLYALSLKDVVKHVITDQTFGVFPAVSLMTFNKNSWAKLSDGQRKAFTDRMPGTLMRVVHGYYAGEAEGERQAREKNIKFGPIGGGLPEKWAAFQKNEPAAVLAAAKARGVKTAEQIIATNQAALKKWEAIVAKIGQDPAKLAEEIKKEVFAKAKL